MRKLFLQPVSAVSAVASQQSRVMSRYFSPVCRLYLINYVTLNCAIKKAVYCNPGICFNCKYFMQIFFFISLGNLNLNHSEMFIYIVGKYYTLDKFIETEGNILLYVAITKQSRIYQYVK